MYILCTMYVQYVCMYGMYYVCIMHVCATVWYININLVCMYVNMNAIINVLPRVWFHLRLAKLRHCRISLSVIT